MKTPRQLPTPRRRAFAILMALASTLLVSSIVLVFFNRATFNRTSANSSGNTMKADTLAISAMDIITAEIIQEIRQVKLNDQVVGNSPNKTFLPKTESIVPQTNAGIDRTKTPNLIKVTDNSQPFWEVDSSTRGRDLGSSVSTATPSLNRRWVDPNQWLSNGMHFAPSDPTHVDKIKSADVDATPDWVFVTRANGITASPTIETDKFNPNYPIGRFAAAVYDVSGLVDLNSAGHSAKLTAAQQAELVGSLGAIDLASLNSDDGSTIAFGNSDTIDAFIEEFRNSSTLGVNTSKYHDTITDKAAKTGRLFALEGDNLLLSRKDLLRLSKTPKNAWVNQPTYTPIHPDAHYQFTHFSRELSQPSFTYPATGTGNNPVRNTINANIHSLRMASAGEAPDGFSWKQGDPVVPRRFALSRLELVAYDADPDKGEYLGKVDPLLDEKIRKYFGLYRDTDAGPWLYVGSDDPTNKKALGSIDTLAQVAAAGREPNFFELLKAAIHDDSIGVTSGFKVGGNNQMGWAPNADDIDGLADLHILRIGANIIDQADEDSYPTVVAYDPAGFEIDAYGIEDLPYIHGFGIKSVTDYSDVTNPNDLKGYGESKRQAFTHFVPFLWNPHRDINSSTGPGPRNLQFYFIGQTRYVLRGYDIEDDDKLGTESYNDEFHYTTQQDAPSRFNEFGLAGHSLPLTESNRGYIQIPSNIFRGNTFRQPNYIQSLGSTGTGSYDFKDDDRPEEEQLPYHDPGVLGLTLKRQVIAKPREWRNNGVTLANSGPLTAVGFPDLWAASTVTDAQQYAAMTPREEPVRIAIPLDVDGDGSADQDAAGNDIVRFHDWAWDGGWIHYRTFESHLIGSRTGPRPNPLTLVPTPSAQIPGFTPMPSPVHHFLNPGTQGKGLNAVLRYQDHKGNWQVYNAFASNVADRDGTIGTPFDAYAMKGNGNSLNGIWMWKMGFGRLDSGLATHDKKNNWRNAGTGYKNGWIYGGSHFKNAQTGFEYFSIKPDPRTARFGISGDFHGKDMRDLPLDSTNITDNDGAGQRFFVQFPATNIYRVSTMTGGNAGRGKAFPSMWGANYPDGPGTQVFDWPSGGTGAGRGVARPGDDFLTRVLANDLTNPNSLYFNQNQRPVVLNRPFKSVGELGFVFRDMPMKTLDMFSSSSVDAALLDYFTVTDTSNSVVAGKFNPNAESQEIFEMLLTNVERDPKGGLKISANNAGDLATDFFDPINNPDPIKNAAELVPRFYSEKDIPDPNDNSKTITVPTISGATSGAYPAAKTLREAPIRALSEVVNARTWNLMVDVVAQTGRYTQASSKPEDFLVEGQTRYWMHIAIDRYTGKIIDRQIELATP